MEAATYTELKTEQALAKRWLRTGLLPLPAWQWLSGRQVSLADHLPVASPLLMKSLEAFAEPLGAHSSSHEQQSLGNCLANAGQLITYCYQSARGPAISCQQRMLAASLLPLYRGLARGSVAEVTSVLRRQLADALTIHATLIEFNDELPDLLGCAMADDHSPYVKFEEVFDADLQQVTQGMLAAGAKWDGRDLQQLDAVVREQHPIDWRPAWGLPGVLWRLAGELISQRPEFVVPRDWIDVPVPWNEASEHWLDVVHALEQSMTASLPSPSPSQRVDANASGVGSTAATKNNPQPAQSIPTQSSSTPSSAEAPSSDVNADVMGDDIQRLRLEIEIADAVDSLVQASRQSVGNLGGDRNDGSHPAQSPRPRQDEFIVPKIIIAEVRSHNDPAFVSVARRQLALCRSEERCMSLLAIKVSPDGEEGNMPTLQSLGLASWQQKLVNWMSEHPEIRDPYAFLSNEGELILSLIDIERNTATLILRQGLNEVLSAASNDDASLNRAAAPARYHAGIGSVSSPTASFEPEQLIEATYRCLDAATRHGKASIKSIEVF